MPQTQYVTHLPLKKTGVGFRSHDPNHLVNSLVPEGEIALGFDHGWTSGNPVTDPPPATYESVVLHGKPADLLKALEKATEELRGLIALRAKEKTAG